MLTVIVSIVQAKFRRGKLQKVKLTVSVKSILLMEADLKVCHYECVCDVCNVLCCFRANWMRFHCIG